MKSFKPFVQNIFVRIFLHNVYKCVHKEVFTKHLKLFLKLVFFIFSYFHAKNDKHFDNAYKCFGGHFF